MTDEQKDKYYCCINEITNLIRFALNKRVTAEYFVDDKGGEFVDVVDADHKSLAVICVTGEDILSMAAMVLETIGGHKHE